ncbi:hypothetical protein [Cellulosimicrobium protaetiae]|uniref:DUF4352 domain-containing protein n=1 Tax=Cellulosimicrobium protaetiae TaxID=2587808 RepID=A0A6M5UFQ0_9MICO|nr:hypothetical protein [Cellulosimicrobium protaetiae]QJW37366.1 hypothetical protein FIC82_015465 [Cellulosimicrobium protaetiae]
MSNPFAPPQAAATQNPPGPASAPVGHGPVPPAPTRPVAGLPGPPPPAARRGLSRTAVGLIVGAACLAVGGGVGFAVGVASDAGGQIAAWYTAPVDEGWTDDWSDEGWTDDGGYEGDWEGAGTRGDPWYFDGISISGEEWDVLLDQPYEATAEILAHDDVNVAPSAGTEYWIVPVTATYYGPSSEVNAWGAIDVGFVGDDGLHADGQCGAVPDALVGTGIVGTDDTVTGNVCLAVPAGAPGLWTLSIEGYEPWYLTADDPLAG